VAAGVLVSRGDAKDKNVGSQVRTTHVTKGTLIKTIRLTGTTTAERFALLIAPRLRGMRSPSTGSSTGSGSTTANSSATSATAAAAGSATQMKTGASSAGTAINASSAFRSATSRVGGSNPSGTGSAQNAASGSSSTGTTSGTSTTSGKSASTSSSASSSTTMGSSGLGSTSSQLYSGGGGNDNDFNLVLHEVASPGTVVKKGQVVAEFDRQYMLLRLGDFKDAVTQNASSLKSQTADIIAQKETHDQLVASAKADVDKAELDMKTIPVLSRIDAERTRMALEQARAKYKQLLSEAKFVNASNAALLKGSQLTLQQSQLELEHAQMNVDKMLVHAPMSGSVVMESIWRSGDRGQIKKGDQLRPGTRYMRIVDPSQMRVNAVVNQADVAFLRVGQKARVSFDAYPGLTLDAHVESVPPATNTGFFRADYVRTVPVRLRLDQSDPRLIPDLSVGIDVDVSEATNAVIIERAAIFGGTPQSGQKTPHVFVESGNTWALRPIRVGLQNNVSAVVLNGVEPGEVVALDTPPGARGQT
jgi:HlyD family secretion protein